ncbi:MAG: hypothetical protein J7K46_12025 [Bacteroidales bacterium]|nr:hypothetical protein [Bacteroidales bacterium]
MKINSSKPQRIILSRLLVPLQAPAVPFEASQVQQGAKASKGGRSLWPRSQQQRACPNESVQAGLPAPGKKKILLLDTTPIKMQAADINFVKTAGMLLVPTFGNNRVVAYRYK